MLSMEDLFNETERAVVVSNHLGLITYVNTPFESLLGWPHKDIIGKPLTVIIPAAMRQAHQHGMERYMQQGAGRLVQKPIQLPVVTRSGEQLLTRQVLVADQEAGDWFFGSIIELAQAPDRHV